MLYIITYATHDERYFKILKKSYPDIIVLGYGTKWNGFHDKVKATIDFCKDKNDDDLILFVDGFDSIILHTDNIIEKYKSFNVPLVFSKDLNNNYILVKYNVDSFFDTCQSLNLNSGLYIGTPKSIIHFWENINLNDDDQVYATKICNELGHKYIKIDEDNKIFYNYSRQDNVFIDPTNNKIKIKNEFPNIISAPAYGNINYILIKLGYNIIDNEKDFKINFKRILSNISRLKLEIILLILFLIIIFNTSNKKNNLFILILLFFELLNYQLYIKHLKVDKLNKFIYILVNLLQIILIYIIYLLFDNNNCNLKKILLLNIIHFLLIIFFLFFRKCIFNIVKEFITGINKHISKYTQIKYLLDINNKYRDDINKNDNHDIWIQNNLLSIIFIFILNLYCLISFQ